jgi:hypothetical protein
VIEVAVGQRARAPGFRVQHRAIAGQNHTVDAVSFSANAEAAAKAFNLILVFSRSISAYEGRSNPHRLALGLNRSPIRRTTYASPAHPAAAGYAGIRRSD